MPGSRGGSNTSALGTPHALDARGLRVGHDAPTMEVLRGGSIVVKCEQEGAPMTDHVNDGQLPGDEEAQGVTENAETRDDIAEKPGTDDVSHEHADAIVDEWGEDSFPGSDPPAHY